MSVYHRRYIPLLVGEAHEGFFGDLRVLCVREDSRCWKCSYRLGSYYFHILSIYPATRSAMRRLVAMSAILRGIFFFASFHQSTTLTPAGMTNESHIIKAVNTPEYWGIARMVHASPIIMSAVMTNSVTRSFHMPSMSFLFSASLNGLSPWCICIQSFPNIGPNHTAPNIHDPTVIVTIASQLSPCIR